jgi:nanoRNase/pAp phosphatase (c-di-AMP/oligoRNAs hydrolase)
MPSTNTASKTQSDQLLDVLADFEQVLLVMHDNPDPDAIASGWALQCLIEERLGKPARLIGGGAIVRAENKHMVDLLGPPIQLVESIAIENDTATILVDCSVGTSNQLLTRAGIEPIAVIDHHVNGSEKTKLRFKDIRHDAAASASIAASYLQEQGIDPGVKLATAILYAIRTETCGCETYHSRLDRSVVRWLAQLADPELLAEIQNAPLEPEYFGDLSLAMQGTDVYDDAALCFLPRAHGAEIVGEVADLLVRCRGIRQILCAAIIGTDVLISVRTQKNGENAARLLQATLEGLGGSGGHSHRAGGKICNVGNGPNVADEQHEKLRERWLNACGVAGHPGTRLIARREIVENL